MSEDEFGSRSEERLRAMLREMKVLRWLRRVLAGCFVLVLAMAGYMVWKLAA